MERPISLLEGVRCQAHISSSAPSQTVRAQSHSLAGDPEKSESLLELSQVSTDLFCAHSRCPCCGATHGSQTQSSLQSRCAQKPDMVIAAVTMSNLVNDVAHCGVLMSDWCLRVLSLSNRGLNIVLQLGVVIQSSPLETLVACWVSPQT